MERWSKGKKKNYFLTLIMENLKEKILSFKLSDFVFIDNTKTIEFFTNTI